MTLSEAVKSRHNIHKPAYNTVRQRVLAGLDIETALAKEPTTTGKIRAFILDKDDPKDMW